MDLRCASQSRASYRWTTPEDSLRWLRRCELHARPPGHEPGELLLLHSASKKAEPSAGLAPACSCLRGRCRAVSAWTAAPSPRVKLGTTSFGDSSPRFGGTRAWPPCQDSNLDSRLRRPVLAGSRETGRFAGREGIEPSHASFGGSAVAMTLRPVHETWAPAERFERPLTG